MKQLLHCILILLLASSCTQEQRETSTPKSTEDKSFDFSRFEIGKGRIGSILVGQTISQADAELTGLTRDTLESYFLNFDGGGDAYLYRLNGEPVLALVPTYDSDSIIAIVALHKDLNTPNGLHASISAEELVSKYPKNLFFQDLMNGGEVMVDEENNWLFVFNTDEKDQIGVYPDIDEGSIPKNLKPKVHWITIR